MRGAQPVLPPVARVLDALVAIQELCRSLVGVGTSWDAGGGGGRYDAMAEAVGGGGGGQGSGSAGGAGGVSGGGRSSGGGGCCMKIGLKKDSLLDVQNIVVGLFARHKKMRQVGTSF